VGFDNHPPSIEHAPRAAATAGLDEDRVRFEVAPATSYPVVVGGYDLIAFFDCLHDMGDPPGAIRHAADSLASDGTVLLVEPMAGERIEDNLNEVGQVYSGASVLLCAPHALAEGGQALGTIVTEPRLREVATAGGLSRFRRATQTPFNRVFEARI
jgi:SAM-dependent methyltransferase